MIEPFTQQAKVESALQQRAHWDPRIKVADALRDIPQEITIGEYLAYIGTPFGIYLAMEKVSDEGWFDGIDPKAWNATVKYYVTPISLQGLAEGARDEFGLNIGSKSLGAMQKVIRRTMQTVQQTLQSHGLEAFEAMDLDQRKDMHAEYYLQKQKEAVGKESFRDVQRRRIAEERPDCVRRQRSSETMKAQRQDPIFMDNLRAGIASPERGGKISASLRANEADMARRAEQIGVLQVDRPLPSALLDLIGITVEQQNDLIEKAYTNLLSDPQALQLVQLLTQEKDVEQFNPLLQGFLLMSHIYDTLDDPIRPMPATIKKVQNTIHRQKTQVTIVNSLKKRKKIFRLVDILAQLRFPDPIPQQGARRGVHLAAVMQERIASRNSFLSGAALAYNLHARMEIMQYKHLKQDANHTTSE